MDSPAPNLGQSRGPYRGFGSKAWVPRNTAGHIGGFIFGVTFVTSGLAMIVGSFGLKGELRTLIQSPLIGLLVSFFVVILVLGVACWLVWYGSRLFMGSFRRPSMRKS
jgi:hypothetical protein